MSYRKINVAGTQYEYVVGTSHLKIKNIGIYHIEEVGQEVKDLNDQSSFMITPAIVKSIIEQFHSSIPLAA